MTQPHILLINDDGIDAPGLAASQRALGDLYTHTIIAPTNNRSAIGHAISLGRPISVEQRIPVCNEEARIAIDGTPADCAKYALKNHYKTPPDLVVSGINNGPNIGVNVHYSGTVAAALEAVSHGIPAVALSVGNYHNPDWATAIPYVQYAVQLAFSMLTQTPESAPPLCLNVNIPDRPDEEIMGIRITKQGRSGFDEIFVPRPDDPENRYELTGRMVHRDTDGLFDGQALQDGYVSITPLCLDLTATAWMDALSEMVQQQTD